MEVHNISIDENEGDTSADEVDDEEEYQALFGAEGPEGPHQCSQNYITKPVFQETFRDWERPKVDLDTMFFSSSVTQEQPEDFHFFLVDVVSTVTSVRHPGIRLDPEIEGMPLHHVVRLFGVTTTAVLTNASQDDGFVEEDYAGHDRTKSISVCCNVHGFLPYFYVVPVPLKTRLNERQQEEAWKSERKQEEFRRWLDDKIKIIVSDDLTCSEYFEFVAHKNSKCVVRVENLKDASNDDGIYQLFQSNVRGGKNVTVLKVFCSLPRFIWSAKLALNNGYEEDGWKFEIYEANLNSTVRFLTHSCFSGSSWYEVKGGQYFVRNFQEDPSKESYCQLELDTTLNGITALSESHPRCGFNPALRVLSFDIEVLVSSTAGAKPPIGGNCQVIQIGAVVGNYFEGAKPQNSTVGKAVFVIGTCDKIEDARVVQFYIQEKPDSSDENYLEDAEAAMLSAWRDFIIQMDPDLILGYNIKKFDLPYLIDRSSVLSPRHKIATGLMFTGRLRRVKCKTRQIQHELKKVHMHDEIQVNVPGRVVMDMYPLVTRHDRQRGGPGYFKLSNVAKRYLDHKEEKQDVQYTEIEGLQKGDATTRNRLARYCLQDAVIPYLLLFNPVPSRSETICYLDLYFRKSRLGGPILRYYFNKSISYNDYFKQVRVQKNPKTSTYIPDTPSPRKPFKARRDQDQDHEKSSNDAASTSSIKQCKRNLFSDENDFCKKFLQY